MRLLRGPVPAVKLRGIAVPEWLKDVITWVIVAAWIIGGAGRALNWWELPT